MQRLPLNGARNFVTWANFDLGHYLDCNPAFVRRGPDEAWAVFSRNDITCPLFRGSIWAVRVDAGMMPLGRPVQLVFEGIDPRAIWLGDAIVVFYVLVDRDSAGGVTGSSVALARFVIEDDRWRSTGGYVLPKHPIGGGRMTEAHQNWEKNWVPFAIDATHVGLIYAHDPWDVLTLTLEPAAAPRLEHCHRSPAIRWDYGVIRGGTPPLPYGFDHLITVFHASQVVGSRRIYTAGACVFQAQPPYAPVSFTPEPLLVAPYKTDMQRFGKKFAISVVFPMGAERVPGGYRLLCGLDDGEIAHFTVRDDELATRLAPVQHRCGAVLDYRTGLACPGADRMLYVPPQTPDLADVPMVNFLKILAGRGRCFVDIGAGIGLYTMGLAPGFERVIAFEPSPIHFAMLRRNRALNDYAHVACDHAALDGAGTLDARGLTDVDLLRIAVNGAEHAVLAGAARTIGASRPPILIDAGEDATVRQSIAHAMDEAGYSFESLFPRSPQHALCLPRERRDDFAWFV